MAKSTNRAPQKRTQPNGRTGLTTYNVKKSKPVKNARSLESSVIKVENPRNIYNMYRKFSGMTPNELHWILEAARKGMSFWKSLFFEEIRRRDLRLGGICQTRKLAVAAKEHEISFSAESPVPENVQDEVLIFIENVLGNISLSNFISDIVEAQLQGVSTFEINWAISDGSMEIPAGKTIIKGIDYIPNHLLCFDDLNNEYRFLDSAKADAMMLRTRGNTTQDRVDLTGLVVEQLNPVKVIEVHSLDGNAQNGFMNGCIDSLIWSYIFKNYGIKDWAAYVERFATPAVIGKYPPLMNAADRAVFKTAIENFGQYFRMVIPNGSEVDLPTDSSKSASNDLFGKYLEYWNKEMSIRVLGQDLTTSSGDNGSRALGQVHDQVRGDLVLADMLLVKQAMNEVIRRLVYFNFPALAEYPKFKYPEEENIEYKKDRSTIFTNLYTAGWKVSREDVENEFDVTVEEVVKPEPVPYSGQLPSSFTEKSGIQKYIDQFTASFKEAVKPKSKKSWRTRIKNIFLGR